MNLLKLLQEVNLKCQKISTDAMQSIMKMCNQNRDIEEIVRYLLNEFENETDEDYIQGQLQSFIYDCGYDVSRNEFHNVDCLYKLDSFLSNVFMDDSEEYFIWDEHGIIHWVIFNEENHLYSDDLILVTPSSLLEKAKENTKMIRNFLERKKRN